MLVKQKSNRFYCCMQPVMEILVWQNVTLQANKQSKQIVQFSAFIFQQQIHTWATGLGSGSWIWSQVPGPGVFSVCVEYTSVYK